MKKTIITGKKLISIVSVFAILAVSLLSIFVGVSFKADAAAPTPPPTAQVWDGIDANPRAVQFDGGEGSSTQPYLISNGDQLFKMLYEFGKSNLDPSNNINNLDGYGAYYKLTCDIWLNDTTNYDQWQDPAVRATLNNWYGDGNGDGSPDLNGRNFFGYFDGNGFTIYGLYAEKEGNVGFVNSLEYSAKIASTTFEYAHMRTSWVNPNQPGDANWNRTADRYNGAVGVIMAKGGGSSASEGTPIFINNCTVRNCYAYGYRVAGLIGNNDGHVPVIKDCLVVDNVFEPARDTECSVAALMNDEWGTNEASISIKNCVFTDYTAYGAGNSAAWNGYKIPCAGYKIKFENVFTDVEHSFTINHDQWGEVGPIPDEEVTVVESSELKGLGVSELMPFDYDYDWTPRENDYPKVEKEFISPYYGPADEYTAAAPVDVWDGKRRRDYSAGDGTVSNPYIIDTCSQFYFMVTTPSNKAYFKLADGLEVLDFNDLPYQPEEIMNFQGYLDGNGVTIKGVNFVGKDDSKRGGLFPQAGSCTIKNLTVTESYFKSNGDDGAAVLIGDLTPGAAVNIRNVRIIGNEVQAVKYCAGLVACTHTTGNVFVDDCLIADNIFYSTSATPFTGAFVAGEISGSSVTVKNSVALGVYPAADNIFSYSGSYINVYTDTGYPSIAAEKKSAGINIVSNKDAYKGEAAKTTLAGFDFENTWVVTEDYPKLKNHSTILGTPGVVWSGKIADGYAGGNGSQNDPYQIDTPERLAQMLNYSINGAYYELTADINLNDTAAADWYTASGLKAWFTSSDAKPFGGKFNGAGYTIRGLYYSDLAAGISGGLFPLLGSAAEIRNVRIDDSYMSGSAGSFLGAVAGSIQDEAIVTVGIRGANIGENVAFAGAGTVGGIVGRVGVTKLRLDNSIFKGTISTTGTSAGIVAAVDGKLELKDSISVGSYPVASADNVKITTDTSENITVFTDVAGDVANITTLPIENMKGDNAKTYMLGLDFDPDNGTWVVETGKTPEPNGRSKSYNGVVGEVWSGEMASNFREGNGMPHKPYIIYTAEELALALGDTEHYGSSAIKLAADIYLNDVSDELWAKKVGQNQWFTNRTVTNPNRGRKGDVDGDGYAVFGLFYYNTACPDSTYIGLIPQISGSIVIKNLAMSQVYIVTNADSKNSANNVYSGCVFGMGSDTYGIYADSAKLADITPDSDDGTVKANYKGNALPRCEQIIIDHTCYVRSGNACGLGNPGGTSLVTKNCISTGTFECADNADRTGALGGNTWAHGSQIYTSLGFSQNDRQIAAGTHQWSTNDADACFNIVDSYFFGSDSVLYAKRLARPQWRVGEEAKENMPGLDWENVWRTEPEGTPVLRIFDKPDRSASIFSDKQFKIAQVTIGLNTGSNDVKVDSLTGEMYSPITLPTITRPGYKFTGWYCYDDLSLEYPYEFYLSYPFVLYAGWELTGVVQTFEDYADTMYDYDEERWTYNKPGVKGGYKAAYVRNGGKSMHLLNTSAEDAEMLINYENTFTVGQKYDLYFWVTTDEVNNPDTTLSLVQKTYPDYVAGNESVDEMTVVKGLTVGEWTQVKYTFTAKSPWMAIRATGNSSLYFDDIVADPVGEMVKGEEYRPYFDYVGE